MTIDKAMINDQVKRVARAICIARGKNPDHLIAVFEDRPLVGGGILLPIHKSEWEECLKEAAAAIAAMDPGWQPIDERTPRNAICDFWLEWAEGCGPGKPMAETRWASEQRHRGKFDTWSSVYTATHWRPLPGPPR